MIQVADIFVVVVMLAVAVCGNLQLHQQVPQLGPTIVQGEDADIANYPYHVTIMRSNGSCGGSIISTNFVMTAAHCFKDEYELSRIIVRAGFSKATRFCDGQDIKIKTLYIHPKYQGLNCDYDCAVIELANSLIFGTCVQSIQLPPASYEIQDRQIAILTGRNNLGDGVYSDALQVSSISLIATKTCQDAFGSYIISSRKICGVWRNTRACFGDSGGPLVADQYQIGIQSISVTGVCGDGPTVYTKVSEMLPFINRFLKPY